MPPCPTAPRDALLRSFGFRIHSRPKHGEPLWQRGGRVVRESEAVVEMVREQERRKERTK